MLKKLKSLFFVEDESAAAAQGKSTSSEEKATPEANQSSVKKEVSSNKMSNPAAVPSKKFIDVLLKAIEANNLEGFDYLEFKQSLQSLTKVEMDEVTRYQSALAMAKTMGANKKSLVSSGNPVSYTHLTLPTICSV